MKRTSETDGLAMLVLEFSQLPGKLPTLATGLLAVAKELRQVAERFLQEPPTPQRTFEFEHEIEAKLREAGRKVVEATYNAAEGDSSRGETTTALPARVKIAGQEYRRNRKTPRDVATLFGKIKLRRFIYQSVEPGQPGIAPLEHRLGIVAGAATPGAGG